MPALIRSFRVDPPRDDLYEGGRYGHGFHDRVSFVPSMRRVTIELDADEEFVRQLEAYFRAEVEGFRGRTSPRGPSEPIDGVLEDPTEPMTRRLPPHR